MKTQVSPELKAAISQIAEKIKPILDVIHESPATTKNYYVDYMLILNSVNKDRVKLYALAMIEAGANIFGVEAATKIICG